MQLPAPLRAGGSLGAGASFSLVFLLKGLRSNSMEVSKSALRTLLGNCVEVYGKALLHHT